MASTLLTEPRRIEKRRSSAGRRATVAEGRVQIIQICAYQLRAGTRQLAARLN